MAESKANEAGKTVEPLQITEMYTFLNERGVSITITDRMKNEKIDSNTVLMMSDDQLSEFLNLGDRLALINFCGKGSVNGASGTETKTKRPRENLLDNLRKKFQITKKSGSEKDHAKKPYPSKNACKSRRNIEIGWLHSENGSVKQVRLKMGGGTRNVSIHKSATKTDLMQLALDLFFPNGKSTKGHRSDFLLNIVDFKEGNIDGEVNVGELYQQFNVRILRFYLISETPKPSVDSSDGETYLPTIPSCIPRPTTPTASTSTDGFTNSDDWLPDLIGGSIDEEIQFGPVAEGTDIFDSLSVTIPMVYPLLHSTPTIHPPPHVITIARGDALKQLTKEFANPELLNRDIVMYRKGSDGVTEAGVGSGVIKDCLSEYWQDFYSLCTVGNDVKVPFLRHDLHETEWKATGRILLYGWKNHGYLPIKLAPVIIEEALYGTVHSNIMETFFLFVDPVEREVLKDALDNFEDRNEDDLMEVLEAHQCRKIPTAENLSVIINEMAHKELIQTPMYVIDCWRSVLQPMAHVEYTELRQIFDQLLPTNKRVLNCIAFPKSQSSSEKAVSKYLQKYIKELSPAQLSNFLRYTTGSNIITCSSIEVMFTSMSDFTKRPVGHTCGNVIELPNAYDNYPDFRTDFDKILESNVWVMDFS